MLCKKDIVLFLFLHKTYVLDILIKRGDSNKYPKHMLLEFLIQYSTIFLINCHQWAEVSWHLNCHYNEFCRCIECWYEEGWLYIATDMCANENQNQFVHPRSLIRLSFLRMKNFVSLTIPNASNEDVRFHMALMSYEWSLLSRGSRHSFGFVARSRHVGHSFRDEIKYLHLWYNGNRIWRKTPSWHKYPLIQSAFYLYRTPAKGSTRYKLKGKARTICAVWPFFSFLLVKIYFVKTMNCEHDHALWIWYQIWVCLLYTSKCYISL